MGASHPRRTRTEAAQGTSRRRALLRASTAILPAALVLATAAPAMAQPLPAPNARPTGGQVSAGSASIAQGATTTTITQTTDRAAINWQSFNVGSQQTVEFRQPSAQSWTLNRVTAPDPSVVAGRITANGGVAIVNQSGVVFAEGAQVNVGSLIASAANITDRNFMAGKMVFDGAARPGARVENRGEVTVAEQGIAVLAGPRAANSGTIRARLGRAALAGGAETYSLDLAGDGLLSIDVTQAVRTGTAGGVALATNSGVIDASGGSVVITASAASGLVEDLVRNTGSIAANTEGARRGQVALRATGGNVRVEGRVEARGAAPGTRGGTVEATATGGQVTVAAGARIDASGAAGGGRVALGVDAASAPGRPQRLSRRTVVERGATVAADATVAGAGGTVLVNAAEQTTMQGALSARGAGAGAPGGFVEISGGGGFTIQGTADVAGGPGGAPGTLLLDPDAIVVRATLPGGEAGQDQPPAGAGPATISATGAAGTLYLTPNVITGFAGDLTLEALRSITFESTAGAMTKASGGLTLSVTGAQNATTHGVFLQNASLTLSAGALTVTAPGGRVQFDAAVSAQAGVSLSGAAIAVNASLTALSGGVSLTGSAGIALNNRLLADGQTLTLRSDGAITQSSVTGATAAMLVVEGMSANSAPSSVSLPGIINGIQAIGDVRSAGDITIFALPLSGGLMRIAGAVRGGDAATVRIESSQPIAVDATGSVRAGSLAGAETGTVRLWGQSLSLAGAVEAGNTVQLVAAGGSIGPAIGAAVPATITQSGAGLVRTRRLAIGAGQAATLDLDNQVSEAGGRVDGGALTLRSTAALTIADAAAIRAPNGTGDLVLGAGLRAVGTGAAAGGVTVEAPRLTVTRDLSSAGGDVSVTAFGAPGASSLIARTGGSIAAAGSGRVVTLTADALSVTGPGTAVSADAATGTVVIRPASNAAPLTVGGAGGGLDIAPALLAQVSARTLSLRSLGTGGTPQAAAVGFAAGAGALALTGIGVLDLQGLSVGQAAGSTIAVGRVTGQATGGDFALERAGNRVDAFSGISASGGGAVRLAAAPLTSGGSLALDGITGAAGVTAGSGGDLSVQGAGTRALAGDVRLTATGHLGIGAAVTADAGGVVLRAEAGGAPGTIAQTAGIITAGGAGAALRFEAEGAVTQPGGSIAAGRIEAGGTTGGSSGPASLTLAAAGNAFASIGTVGAAGDIRLFSTAALSVEGAVTSANAGAIRIETPRPLGVAATGSIASGSLAGADQGSVSLWGQGIALDGPVQAGASIALTAAAGSLTGTPGSTLPAGIVQAGLGTLTTRRLGASAAAGSIDLRLDNAVQSLAARAAGPVAFRSVLDLAIGAGLSVTAPAAGGGAANIGAGVATTGAGGGIGIEAPSITVTDGIGTASGDIALTAFGGTPAGSRILRSGGSAAIAAGGAAGTVTLTADAIGFGGSGGATAVQAGATGGTVVLRPFSDATPITVGTAGPGLLLAPADLALVAARTLSLRSLGAGASPTPAGITLAAPASLAQVAVLDLRGAGIGQTAGGVAGLAVGAVTGTALSGGFELDGTANAIGAFGPVSATAGAVRLASTGTPRVTGSIAAGADSLLLGTAGLELAADVGIGAAHRLTLRSDGAITQTAGILTAGGVTIGGATGSAAGSATLQRANQVGALDAEATGGIAFASLQALTLERLSAGADSQVAGRAGLLVAGTADAGAANRLALHADGAIEAGPSGAVLAGRLAAKGDTGPKAGPITLDAAANRIGTLEEARSTGAIRIRSDIAGSFTVQQADAAAGLTLRHGASGGTLVLAGSVTAGQDLVLEAAGGIAQTGGSASAARLLLRGIGGAGTAAGGGAALGQAGNAIPVLAEARTAGDLRLRTGGALSVEGTARAGDAATLRLEAAGQLAVAATGSVRAGSIAGADSGEAGLWGAGIALRGPVEGGARVVLVASGGAMTAAISGTPVAGAGVSQPGAAGLVATRRLVTYTNGGVALGAAGNDIAAYGHMGFAPGGDVTLRSQRALTIASLDAGGIAAPDGGAIPATHGLHAEGRLTLTAPSLSLQAETHAGPASTALLVADAFAVDAPLGAPGGGTVAIRPLTPGTAITLGDLPGGAPAPAGIHLDSAEIARIATDGGRLLVGSSDGTAGTATAGAIAIAGPVKLRGGGAGEGDAALLDLRGTSIQEGPGGALEVRTLTGAASAGGVALDGTANLIDAVGAAGLSAGAGNLALRSNLPLSLDGAASAPAGDVAVTVAAAGGLLRVDAPVTARAATGSIALVADDMALGAPLQGAGGGGLTEVTLRPFTPGQGVVLGGSGAPPLGGATLLRLSSAEIGQVRAGAGGVLRIGAAAAVGPVAAGTITVVGDVDLRGGAGSAGLLDLRGAAVGQTGGVVDVARLTGRATTGDFALDASAAGLALNTIDRIPALVADAGAVRVLSANALLVEGAVSAGTAARLGSAQALTLAAGGGGVTGGDRVDLWGASLALNGPVTGQGAGVTLVASGGALGALPAGAGTPGATIAQSAAGILTGAGLTFAAGGAVALDGALNALGAAQGVARGGDIALRNGLALRIGGPTPALSSPAPGVSGAAIAGLTAAAGNVTITAPSITIAAALAAEGAGRSIVLTTDALAIDAALSAGGAGSSILVRPLPTAPGGAPPSVLENAADFGITLGGTAAGTLGITGTAFPLVTTPRLTLAARGTQPINLAAANVALTGVERLVLQGGTVTQAAGGALALRPGTGTLEIAATTGGIDLAASGNRIAALGPLTTPLDIEIASAAPLLTVSGTLQAGPGRRITLRADDMALEAGLVVPGPAAGQVNLLPLTPGTGMTLGGAGVAGTLSLSTAELARVRIAGGGVLRLGWDGAVAAPTAGAIAVTGDVLLRGGTGEGAAQELSLRSASVSQVAGTRISVATLSGRATTGGFALGSLANTIDATLGTIQAPLGVTLASANDFTVNAVTAGADSRLTGIAGLRTGPADTGTQRLELRSDGAIAQTAGIIAAGTVDARGATGARAASILLESANQVARFEGAASGAIRFVSAGALTLGTVLAGADSVLTAGQGLTLQGDLDVTAARRLDLRTPGAVTQTGGTVTAGTLDIRGPGASGAAALAASVALPRDNQVGRFAAATSGDLVFRSLQALTVTGATAGAGDVGLTGVAGLTLAGPVEAGGAHALALRSDGAIAQTAGIIAAGTVDARGATGARAASILLENANQVARFEGAASGAIRFVTTGALTLGTVLAGADSVLTAGQQGLVLQGDLDVTAARRLDLRTPGAVTQTGGTVTAGTLDIRGPGASGAAALAASVALPRDNQVGRFAAATSGDLAFRSLQALTVTGAQAGAGDVGLTGVAGLTLTGPVEAGSAHAITLRSDGGIAQSVAGVLTAGSLRVEGASGPLAGAVLLFRDNQVPVFSGASSAGLAFRSMQGLSVTGLAAGAESILAALPSLTLTGPVTLPGQTLGLRSDGTVSQTASGVVTARRVEIRGASGVPAGPALLDAADNLMSELDAISAGAVRFRALPALTVTGLAAGADSTLTALGGLQLSGTLSLPGRALLLRSDGEVTQPAGAIAAASLDIRGATGARAARVDLPGDNLVPLLAGIDAAGSVGFRSLPALTVGGALSAGGPVSVTGVQGLVLAADVTAGAPSDRRLLVLRSDGTVEQTAGRLAAARLEVRGATGARTGGAVTLPGANLVPEIEIAAGGPVRFLGVPGLTVTGLAAAGDVLLTAAPGITLAGDVALPGRRLDLRTDGALAQTGGIVTASRVDARGAAGAATAQATLPGDNLVGSLSAEVAGTLAFRALPSLTLAGVSAGGGATVMGVAGLTLAGDLTTAGPATARLRSDGPVTQTGGRIASAHLVLEGASGPAAGAVSLLRDNLVPELLATSSAGVQFRTLSALSVAGLSAAADSTITALPGLHLAGPADVGTAPALRLRTDGAVTQSLPGGGLVTAGLLDIRGAAGALAGPVTLPGDNRVGTAAILSTGPVAFRALGPVSILALTADADSSLEGVQGLGIDGPVTVGGTHVLTLRSAGAITEGPGGRLTAALLVLAGADGADAAGSVALGGAQNQVAAVTGRAGGNLALTSAFAGGFGLRDLASANGGLSVRVTGGGLAASGARIAAGGAGGIAIEAAGPVALSGARLSATGTGGGIRIAAGGAMGILSSTLEATDIQATAAGTGGFAVAGSSFVAAQNLTLAAPAGTLGLFNAALSAEQARITGRSLVMENVQAGIGTAILFGGPFGISTTGSLGIAARRPSQQYPAVVFDTRQAPTGADPLSVVQPDLPGVEAVNQRTQVRASVGANSPGAFGPSNAGPAGPLLISALSAGQSPVFMLVDGGRVQGTNILAGRIGAHGTGGSAELFGRLANFDQVEAARFADITRPIAPASLQNYRINGCIFAAISCVPMARSTQDQATQQVAAVLRQIFLRSFDVRLQGNVINPLDVIISNAGERDYE